MKAFFIVLSIAVLSIIIAATGFFWSMLIKTQLPPASNIERVVIFYNEGDQEEVENTKEFDISDANEFELIRSLIGAQKLSKQPLLDSDSMDFEQYWMMSIFFKTETSYYIYIDKNQVSGTKNKHSKIYKYLKKNYT